MQINAIQVILAKEAGLLYGVVAMATDYDCWRETGEKVSADAVVKIFKENASKVTDLFRKVVPKIAAAEWSHHVTELQVRSSTALKRCLPGFYIHISNQQTLSQVVLILQGEINSGKIVA